MIISAMGSGVPACDTMANSIGTLQKWSRLMVADFKKGNSPENGARPDIGRSNPSDMISRMNRSVVQMLANDTDRLIVLQEIVGINSNSAGNTSYHWYRILILIRWSNTDNLFGAIFTQGAH